MTIHQLTPLVPRPRLPNGDTAYPLSLAEILTSPQQIIDLPLDFIPPLLCQLSAIQNALTVRLLDSAPTSNRQEGNPPQDRLLTPNQAATLLGVTIKWLYRHAHSLPFTRRLSRKALRFSESALQQWLKTRRA